MSKVISEPNTVDFIKMNSFLVCSIITQPILSLLISYFSRKDKFEHKELLLNSTVRKNMLFVESGDYNNKINFLKSNNQERSICFFCNVSEAGACIVALAFLLSVYLKWYIVITDIIIYIIIASISVSPNLKLAKMMSDFWVKYIQNTRYYNYISDVLSKKEYVEEKNIYHFFDFFEDIFDKEFQKAAEENRNLGKKRVVLEEKNNILNCLFVLFEIFFLAVLCRRELITVGFFVVLLPFAITTYSKVCTAINGINSLSQADKYIAEEKEFLTMEQKKEIKYEKEDKAIKLDGITFSYPNNEKKVLNELSFSFDKGKKYAIVGVNGSGKTTLAKIISGIYEPQNGTVTRSSDVTVLFQDFNKYPFSVAENISLQKDYDVKKIHNILGLLGLQPRINELKNGIESELTNIKEDGVDLSGGQWQRLAYQEYYIFQMTLLFWTNQQPA